MIVKRRSDQSPTVTVLKRYLAPLMVLGLVVAIAPRLDAAEDRTVGETTSNSVVATNALEEAVDEALGRGDNITAYNLLVPRALIGEAWAQYSVGNVFGSNNGFPDSCQEVVWYDKAARRGHHKAMEFLAEAYSVGRGLVRDHAKAYRWILAMIDARRAA